MKKTIGFTLLIMILLIFLQSCKQAPPIRMATYVDLDRFMGDWYVVANIPTYIEKGAHNAIESYSRKSQTEIDTRFTFNKGSFTGPKKEYNPTGFVQDETSNAEWKMQFLWPFKSEFIIMYVDHDYQHTIIGRSKRDYLWIMSREAKINQQKLDQLIQIAVDEGYHKSKIKKVPQH